MRTTRVYAAAALAPTLLLAPNGLGNPPPIPATLIAQSGQAAPGTEPGVSFFFFGLPVLNSSGQVAFSTTLAGANSGSDSGLWRFNGGLQKAIREGDPVPATVGSGLWDGAQDPCIDSLGRLSFFARYDPPSGSSRNAVIEAHPSGVLSLLADDGANQPPRPPGAFTTLDNLRANALSRSGVHTFRSDLSGPGFGTSLDGAIWSGSPGAVSLVAATRQFLPGGSPFTANELGEPVINGSGTVAFFARSDTIVNAGFPVHDQGVWQHKGGALAPVIRVGQQAPGLPAGAIVSGSLTKDIAISDAGEIGIVGVYRQNPAPGGPQDGGALWVGSAGAMRLVAQGGLPAPGVPSGSTFGELFTPALGGQGSVAFTSRLGGNLSGQPALWRTNAIGQVVPVARQGQPVPGEPGLMFVSTFIPILNDAGLLVFQASVGPSAINILGPGLFSAGFDGVPTRIALVGDPLQLGPGDIRTLSGFQFIGATGGQDGRQSAFNAAGTLAMRATFTDGTMAIVTLNIPTPGAMSVLGCAAALGLRRRSRSAGRVATADS